MSARRLRPPRDPRRRRHVERRAGHPILGWRCRSSCHSTRRSPGAGTATTTGTSCGWRPYGSSRSDGDGRAQGRGRSHRLEDRFLLLRPHAGARSRPGGARVLRDELRQGGRHVHRRGALARLGRHLPADAPGQSIDVTGSRTASTVSGPRSTRKAGSARRRGQQSDLDRPRDSHRTPGGLSANTHRYRPRAVLSPDVDCQPLTRWSRYLLSARGTPEGGCLFE